MPDPLVVTAMRQFKARLLSLEAAEMGEMSRQWLSVERALEGQIAALALEFAEQKRAGKEATPAALYRMQRYQMLKTQAEAEFRRYAEWAEERVTEEQALWVQLALDDHAQAIELSYQGAGQVGAFFNRLPREAVEYLVGAAGDGKPVGDLLKRRLAFDPGRDQSSAEVWARLVDSLVQGTARGINPRDTAARMADDLTGGLQKALVIARSEQIRAYRMAGAAQYKESGVVSGQKRLCAHDDRVCAACIADEGTMYASDEPIHDHTSGRCTGVPVVRGLPEVTWESGEDWFRTQPDEVQRSILGAPQLEAFQRGAFGFEQLVTRKVDPVWGGSIVPTPLQRLVG